MDTTETYIKMCGKAREIQGQWKATAWYSVGDFFYDPAHSKFDKGICTVTPKRSDWWADDEHWDMWEKYTWLPRQDQLQEIYTSDFIKGTPSIPIATISFFNTFLANKIDYVLQFTSVEQLWLAFYMSTKYNKVWDGEKWVSKKK